MYMLRTGKMVDSPEAAAEALNMFLRSGTPAAPPTSFWTKDVDDVTKLQLLLRLMELVHRQKPNTSHKLQPLVA